MSSLAPPNYQQLRAWSTQPHTLAQIPQLQEAAGYQDELPSAASCHQVFVCPITTQPAFHLNKSSQADFCLLHQTITGTPNFRKQQRIRTSSPAPPDCQPLLAWYTLPCVNHRHTPQPQGIAAHQAEQPSTARLPTMPCLVAIIRSAHHLMIPRSNRISGRAAVCHQIAHVTKSVPPLS